MKLNASKIGVHRTHCCILHGCKYGDDKNCPVVNSIVKQEYICETCDNTYWVDVKNNIILDRHERIKLSLKLIEKKIEETNKKKRIEKLEKLNKEDDTL